MIAPGALLERFRRPAAVPAAAGEELDAELMPVLEQLDRIEEEARALREAAGREAERRVNAATQEAERTLASWQRRAEAARARAESERRAAIAVETHAIEADAELEAARIRERGLERIPLLVAAAIDCLRDGS